MKERIVKSALNLFWRYGIKSVTMDDIAKELGISKRTIYQHYADKEAILELVIQEELKNQKCDMERLDEDADKPIEQMIQAADQMRTALAHMNPVLFYDLKKYYPGSWELFQSYKHEFIIKSIRDNLVHGIELGMYRSDIDVDVLALLRIEEIEIAFDPTLFPVDKYHMMHVQMQFVHHFLRGVLTEKGFEHYNTIKDKSVFEFNTHEK